MWFDMWRPGGIDAPSSRGPSGRRLYPPVGCRPRRPDEPVLPADVSELQGACERPRAARGVRVRSWVCCPSPPAHGGWVARSSRDRSRASRASASEILRPARHSMRNRSLALGFGAARTRASTWWASRYSGSFFDGLLRTSGSLGPGMLAPGSSDCAGRRPVRLSWAGSGASQGSEIYSPSDCLIRA